MLLVMSLDLQLNTRIDMKSIIMETLPIKSNYKPRPDQFCNIIILWNHKSYSVLRKYLLH